MLHSLDPHQIIAERSRYIEAQIEQRMQELMPVTVDEGKLEALPLLPVEPTDETNKETANKKTPI
jgi:hypothetical protein